jgi:1-acyl-sn-glycerol-3-phosphate acyltransferase
LPLMKERTGRTIPQPARIPLVRGPRSRAMACVCYRAVDTVYSLAKAVFYPALRYGLKWKMEGIEQIPEQGPVLLASNHISYLDPLTLAYVANERNRHVRFLAKTELFATPVLGGLLRAAKQIPVQRGSANAADALRGAVDALTRGECVTVFPEGTISEDLEPMAGKSGTARLARAAGVPVTPVGLWGTHRILHKGRKPHWQWGVAQTAVVGAPVHIGPDDHVKEATDRIMQSLCHCVARAREIYPQDPTDGDDWWWREPRTAVVRSVRLVAGDVSADDDGSAPAAGTA